MTKARWNDFFRIASNHQYGFFHVSSNYLMLSICSHTGSSWMVYNHCGFSHVASNDLMLSICSYTGSSWKVFHWCVFLNVFSSYLFVRIPCHIVDRWMICFLPSFCMHLFGLCFNEVLNEILNACCSWKYLKRGAIKVKLGMGLPKFRINLNIRTVLH